MTPKDFVLIAETIAALGPTSYRAKVAKAFRSEGCERTPHS